MITMITGGQRCGKSEYAEQLALNYSSNPVYFATARIFDEEFRHRVEIHKQRRGLQWINYEEPLYLSKLLIPENTVILLDCLTLLSTNWLFECDEDIDKALEKIKLELDTFLSRKADFIIVTNEIGLGGVSQNTLQRKFTDLQGKINQYVAAMADEVIFMVSGIPMKIKSNSKS